MGVGYGLFGLVILVLDIWGIVNVIGSRAAIGVKLLWILLIVILPVIGLIFWFLAGPRGVRAGA
ncbi:MAG: PLDc N-terminal domain-containing protein [Rhodospirillales bacterium]|nr:PLDc N-terminal domain-containing protein [Rhodospirillales bacterium]